MDEILDPQGAFLRRWNKIFVLSSVIAMSLDGLFFYVLVIDGKKKCIGLDKKVEVIACVLRSFVDIFYVLHILFQFRTGFKVVCSQTFEGVELVKNPYAIAKRYLSSYFIIDILSILPLPQVVLLVIVPHKRGPESLHTKELLKYVIPSQYVPRLVRIYLLYKEVTRAFGIFIETAWGGVAFYLFTYMFVCHVVGASWYFLSIGQQDKCWRRVCDMYKLNHHNLYCGEHHVVVDSFLNASCHLLEPNELKDSTDFNFGIFLEALQSRVAETRDFSGRLLYCFWWGLRNLSSIGQNLRTSTFVGEILFAVFISIIGLVFFSVLIGNMQKYLQYLQSIAVREETMRATKQAAEQWMDNRMLPQDLRARIRRYEQYKWQETKGVEEESLLGNLPRDIRRDIKRHLCFSLLRRVPFFEKMNEQLLDAMCDRLKPVLYSEMSYTIREGDPVEEIVFITQGKLLSCTTNGGSSRLLNCCDLKDGDFFGEELLTWALDPQSSNNNLPNSTTTLQTKTGVKAFSLMADELKVIFTQFRRRHSRILRHTFRYHSLQWRTWAACFIQTAWRRRCRRKLEEKDRVQDAMAKEVGASASLGAITHASKSVINVQSLPPFPLGKPFEPDFAA